MMASLRTVDDVCDGVVSWGSLAGEAFLAVFAVTWEAHWGDDDDLACRWAEAAALLRDGWRPGDPVYLLTDKEP